MGRRVGVGAIFGFALIAVMLGFALSPKAEKRTGTNAALQFSGASVAIPASRKRCQTEASLPARTGEVIIFAKARNGSGPLTVTFSDKGRRLSRARFPRISGEGVFRAPLRPAVVKESGIVRACFDNDGPLNLSLGGNRTPPIGPGNPNQEFPDDDVRIDYAEAGSIRRVAFISRVADRLPLYKSSVLGSWTFLALGLFLILIWAAALLLLVRVDRSLGKR